jgi:hypothetical protein
MRRNYGRNTTSQTKHFFLIAAVLGAVLSIAQAATVEWYFLGSYPPTSLEIAPAAPTIADTISFIAPANGETYLNSFAAADAFGNPLISVDFTNRTVDVTFTARLDEAVPNIVLLVNGVNGQLGPLQAGTWTFNILTNSYTFTVSGPPIGIALTGDHVVISWTALASIYALQVTTNFSSGNWSNVTNGITIDGTNCFFRSTATSQASFYRLRQQ